MLRPLYLPNFEGCITAPKCGDVCHIVGFDPRPLNWLSDGQFLDRFVFDEANLSNFVGAMSWLKNVVIGLQNLLVCIISRRMMR